MSDDDDFMMEEDEDFDFEYESGDEEGGEEDDANVDLENKYYSAKGMTLPFCRQRALDNPLIPHFIYD